MAANKANTSTHDGPISKVSTDATPGLLFLSYFIPALDSLSLALPINSFLHNDCKIILNGGNPITPEQVGKAFVGRASKISKFSREVVRAWEVSDQRTRRTVMFESISTTVLMEDEHQMEVKCAEFTVVELEPMEGGDYGYGVIEMKSWVDTSPVLERMSVVNLKNAAAGH